MKQSLLILCVIMCIISCCGIFAYTYILGWANESGFPALIPSLMTNDGYDIITKLENINDGSYTCETNFRPAKFVGRKGGWNIWGVVCYSTKEYYIIYYEYME